MRRADHSLIGVDVPAGAKEVRLQFASASYARGKTISLIALVTALLMMLVPVLGNRRAAAR